MRAVVVTIAIFALVCIADARPGFQSRTLRQWGWGWGKPTPFEKEKFTPTGLATGFSKARADRSNPQDADAFSATGGVSFWGRTRGKAVAIDKNDGNAALSVSKHKTDGLLAGAIGASDAQADDNGASSASLAAAGVGVAGTAKAATLGAAKSTNGDIAITGGKVDVEGKGGGIAVAKANENDGAFAKSVAVSKGGHVTSKSFAIHKDP